MNASTSQRKSVAIVGASNDRSKYGNKAVRAFVEQGYTVFPVNPHESVVEGLRAYPTVDAIPEPVSMATFYVPPDVGATVLPAVARAGIPEVWLNPGAESDALIAQARALGLRTVVACSITGIGSSPWRY